MSIETYITVHDSTIVAECEDSGRFNSISHTYLFVGPKAVDVADDIKIIVCRDIQPNYEHLPHFYDFTGWFVLGKYELFSTDNAIFLQLLCLRHSPVKMKYENHMLADAMDVTSCCRYENGA